MAPGEVAEALLADVVDPWSWARGKAPADARAQDRQQAIEDIGPFERVRPGDPASPLVNTNADYWTRLAGIAWDRDVDIDFDREPVDLDGDGKPDTTVTRHIHAKGGILANPELFGLTPTPDDPRGRVGRVSVSTGVLGLREPLGPDGKPTGQIGMTCWLCHGEANPTGGAIVLGLPGRRVRLWPPAGDGGRARRRRTRRPSSTGAPTDFPRDARCARASCWRAPGVRI